MVVWRNKLYSAIISKSFVLKEDVSLEMSSFIFCPKKNVV